MREPTALETSEVEWRNWTGDEGCRPQEVVHPGSTEEIAAVVARAAGAGMPVRVAGAGHSFTDIACTARDTDRAQTAVKVCWT